MRWVHTTGKPASVLRNVVCRNRYSLVCSLLNNGFKEWKKILNALHEECNDRKYIFDIFFYEPDELNGI